MYHLTEMHCSLLPVTQLQTTLASVQELLIQQQQKVQELAHELATAKVLVPDSLVLPGPGLPCMALCCRPLCPVCYVLWGLTLPFPTLIAQ